MSEPHSYSHSSWAIFLIFLRLGLTSFGGPVAHIGYFREEFVSRRRWITEHSYADLVALCRFLPGPASSQVGLAIGLTQGGYRGALAAWAGFTLPSALALMLFAWGMTHIVEDSVSGALHGLKVVAVAVVTQAVWGMARTLCTDTLRVTIMAFAACFALLFPTTLGQISVILFAGVTGARLCKPAIAATHETLRLPVSKRAACYWLLIFLVLLTSLPLLTQIYPQQALAEIDAFFRTGSLVFGGGHVVLPLLQAEVVPNGWIDNDRFLAGYGAAQAVPGPLFTFAAFLGTSMQASPSGWAGGLLCLIAIFAPSFLLVAAALPFWEALRRQIHMRAALAGINAAVVGLLLAALYQPVWTSAILSPPDFALALLALVALMFWKVPPWLVVISSGLTGWALNLAG